METAVSPREFRTRLIKVMDDAQQEAISSETSKRRFAIQDPYNKA